MKTADDAPPQNSRLTVSLGVFAHNEEGSIAACLDSLARSLTRSVHVAEIFVVSSGSTDRTNELAAEASRRQPELRLLVQSRKEGKASAVNLFLANARHEHCVLANADTMLHEDAIEHLCAPLRDPGVGMVGCRPVPVAPNGGLLGFANELFWELHHRLCLQSPKMGELVAFRRVFDHLPVDVAGADEDWIHGEVLRQGLRAIYAPSAILYNRGPATLRDFMAHRRRLAVQHLVLKYRCGFSPASRDLRLMATTTLSYVRNHPEQLPRLLAVGALELTARQSAAISYFFGGRTYRNWKPLASSRGITLEEAWRHRNGGAGQGAATDACGSLSERPGGFVKEKQRW